MMVKQKFRMNDHSAIREVVDVMPINKFTQTQSPRRTTNVLDLRLTEILLNWRTHSTVLGHSRFLPLFKII